MVSQAIPVQDMQPSSEVLRINNGYPWQPWSELEHEFSVAGTHLNTVLAEALEISARIYKDALLRKLQLKPKLCLHLNRIVDRYVALCQHLDRDVDTDVEIQRRKKDDGCSGLQREAFEFSMVAILQFRDEPERYGYNVEQKDAIVESFLPVLTEVFEETDKWDKGYIPLEGWANIQPQQQPSLDLEKLLSQCKEANDLPQLQNGENAHPHIPDDKQQHLLGLLEQALKVGHPAVKKMEDLTFRALGHAKEHLANMTRERKEYLYEVHKMIEDFQLD